MCIHSDGLLQPRASSLASLALIHLCPYTHTCTHDPYSSRKHHPNTAYLPDGSLFALASPSALAGTFSLCSPLQPISKPCLDLSCRANACLSSTKAMRNTKPLQSLIVWCCTCFRFSCDACEFIILFLISTGRHLVTVKHLSPSLVSLIGLLRDLLVPCQASLCVEVNLHIMLLIHPCSFLGRFILLPLIGFLPGSSTSFPTIPCHSLRRPLSQS